jgi:cytoskeletal protein RodZ
MKRIILLLISICLFALSITSCLRFTDKQDETTSSILSEESISISSRESSTSESLKETSSKPIESTEDSTEASTEESSNMDSNTWQDENVDNGGWT